MAEITRASFPSMCSPNPSPDKFLTGIAGEAIKAGDQLYISAVNAQGDPVAMKAGGGGAAGLQLRVRGQACADADLGDPVTIGRGLRFYWGTTLTPGADVFLSGATAGGLADAAVGGAAPVGYAVDTTRVQFRAEP